MNNTAAISGHMQFTFNRTQNIPLKPSPVATAAFAETTNNDEEIVMPKKKRLPKLNDLTSTSHPSSSSGAENGKKPKAKKQKKTEHETTAVTITTEPSPPPAPSLPVVSPETSKTEVKQEEPVVASSTNNKKSHENNNNSRSTSGSSRQREIRNRRRRHRRRRRRSSSSSSRSDSSTSSNSSHSSSDRSRRYRRQRRRSSRSSSRSTASSSDNHNRRSSRSSRRSSRHYSRRRSSTSQSSRSSTSSRSSRSRSRSRNNNRKPSRRSGNSQRQQISSNGKGRRGSGGIRRGRGARNGPRGRRAQSSESRRLSPSRTSLKYNSTLGGGIRKLPVNKSPRVSLASMPKPPTTVEEPMEETLASKAITTTGEEIKKEPIIITTNPLSHRPGAQKRNPKGKNKQQQQQFAYSLKKNDADEMDLDGGEPMIGPKLPPEFERKLSNKEHSFTPPDMDDPENIEMLNDLRYRAEIHAAKNYGLITEIEAQQLIDEHETQKQLAEFPIIPMPIMQQPTISPMGTFIMAAPSPTLVTYQLQMAATAAPQVATSADGMSLTDDQQQQQQLSPNSATSSGGESFSTTVVTQDGQSMMIPSQTTVNSQTLFQVARSPQPIMMPMEAAVQQPRIVAMRTPQGGIQHFLEYSTAQLLQQQQQQPQFIQHNGQLVQVIRPTTMASYSSAALLQQIQLQQQQVFAAQFQAQQLTAMQQQSGAFFLQNSAGQFVLAQPNPQAMRVVQIPYVPQ